MPAAPRRQRVVIVGMALLALAAGASAVWRGYGETLADRYRRIVPRDVVLYVYEPGGPGQGLRELARIYPAGQQRRDGLRVGVRTLREDEIVVSVDELLEAFERTAEEPASSKLFVRLASPFRTSKKHLRGLVDAQRRVGGEGRRLLLGRLAPIVGADEVQLQASTPCEQFRDDLAYVEDNFGGFVLRVDRLTLELLDHCLAGALRDHYRGDMT